MISERSGVALALPEGPYFPQSALQGFHPRRASVSEERQRRLQAALAQGTWRGGMVAIPPDMLPGLAGVCSITVLWQASPLG